MHPWKARAVLIYGPHRPAQWCLDNGEEALIPCGDSEDSQTRAEQLAETLNLGYAARARANGSSDNLVAVAARKIYATCQDIEILSLATFSNGSPKSWGPLSEKITELRDQAIEMQNALVR